MTTAVLAAPTVYEARQRIDVALDLGNLRMKLADPNEGKGYIPDHLDLMEDEYRKFLALHVAFPGTDIVPCKLVDEMWHQHILDTRAYVEDCEAIFGGYLHHFPYFGMRGDDDARALHDAYADTLERYREAFGEPPIDTWISAEASRCKRTACKPQRCK
jgi:hypothetical protein